MKRLKSVLVFSNRSYSFREGMSEDEVTTRGQTQSASTFPLARSSCLGKSAGLGSDVLDSFSDPAISR